MYDVQFLKPTGKEMALAIIGVVIVLVVCFSAGYLLGLRNAGTRGKDVPDNGDPAAGVRTEISAAGSGISTAKSRIDNAAAAAGRIEERIDNAAERAEYVKGTANEGRRIIEECQSILREVRNRGKENAPKN